MSNSIYSFLLFKAFYAPKAAFDRLVAEDPAPLRILFRYSLWLLLLPPLFSFVGASQFGWRLGATEPLFMAKEALALISGDLREGPSAPPLWWFWMLLGAMVFSLVYLMLYPGLGSFEGLLNWSQGKRLVSSYENYEASFDTRRAEIASLSLAEVQADPVLMATADRIFRRECSACHGIDGRGQASLFPNLMDTDWQWGGSPEQIEQTLRGGRNANMPAWGPIIGEEKTRDVARYLLDFSNREHSGRSVYEQSCAACHGTEGAGNVFLGAPNLADNIRLYGGDIDSILTTLQEGRLGKMPAFDDRRLDATQLKSIIAKLAK